MTTATSAALTDRIRTQPVDFKTVLGVVQGISINPAKIRKARHSNINDLDRQQMLTMYLSGIPVKGIAYRMCVCNITVYKHLSRARKAGFLTVEHKRGRKVAVKQTLNPLVMRA